ncbi:MAG: winged helix-turn-helix transcriptional regulator [Anaerolineaceae bacterium]|nr:winged helix-turn-helix transcriptional regulator [Anaerolineaceae bacterium]MCC6604038.1 winged helix-turn-helix transcriptional regulator [Anaerolineae bacterium]
MEIPQIEELELLHANICQALGDPKRIQILYALHGEPRYVSALADDLGMPQPTVSRHLQVLRQRSLVLTERDGQTVVYSLADPRIIEVLNTMRRIMRDALDRQTNVLA